MKTLLLMRHAKSSWKIKDIPDHERPLNKRGRKDAPRMGIILDERELCPQTIIASSAMRSRQTAELVAETSGYSEPITFLDKLYMAEADEYLAVLGKLSDTIERVLIIGHNPGLETLHQILSNRIEALPTGTICHIALPIDKWSDLTSETEGELIEIWHPREIEEEIIPSAKKEKTKDKKKKK